MHRAGTNRKRYLLIDYEVAGLGDRIAAFLIDIVLVIAYLTALLLFNLNERILPGWLNLLIALPAILYFLICEIVSRGQSLGKRLLRLKVVKLDGTQPGFGNYLLRFILWPVDNIPYGSVAIITILINGKGQRLGDLAAGTTVVKYSKDLELELEQYAANETEGYELQFEEAGMLSEQDVARIRATLRSYRLSGNTKPVQALAEQLQLQLGLQTNLPPLELLQTLVKDHQLLSTRS